MGVSISLARTKSSTRSSVRIKVSVCNTSFMVYPGISVETALWDNKNKVIQAKTSASSGASAKLKMVAADIDQMLDDFKYRNNGKTFIDLKHQILEKYSPNYTNYSELSKSTIVRDFFWGMIEDMQNGLKRNSKNKPLTASTIYSYTQSYKYFQAFDSAPKKYSFSNFKNNEINKFRAYLLNDLKLSNSTVDKIFRHLRSVIRYAAHLGKIEKSHLSALEFKIGKSSGKNNQIYLRQEEVDAILNIETFKNTTAELTRDLFIVGCYTGMRVSDLIRLNDFVVECERIHLVQQKTGDGVRVPIHPIVDGIYNKYDGTFPKISYQSFYKYVKEIGATLPSLKEEIVVPNLENKTTTRMERALKFSTHTARRTFVTLGLLAGTPPVDIMHVAGFKTIRSFLVYVRASSVDLSNKAANSWGL